MRVDDQDACLRLILGLLGPCVSNAPTRGTRGFNGQ
jgi:hypothetical protein